VAASPWWESWVAELQPYAVLLRLLIDATVGAPEFEILFLRLYKNDGTDWPPDVFSVLDEFFADVDAYCADAALRVRVHGIGAEELRARAERTFARLESLAG
jgi:Bacterial self-protective colicin-like immunity